LSISPFGLRLVEVGDHDPGAGCGQLGRVDLTDPLARTGDDGDLVGEIHGMPSSTICR
jgi:hypothetical protein